MEVTQRRDAVGERGARLEPQPGLLARGPLEERGVDPRPGRGRVDLVGAHQGLLRVTRNARRLREQQGGLVSDPVLPDRHLGDHGAGGGVGLPGRASRSRIRASPRRASSASAWAPHASASRKAASKLARA